MKFEEILDYLGMSQLDVAKKGRFVNKDLWKYFNGKKTAGGNISEKRVAICDALNFEYELVAWPRIEGKTKWEALWIEAKRLQELDRIIDVK